MLDSNVIEKTNHFLANVSHIFSVATHKAPLIRKYYKIAEFIIKLQFINGSFLSIITPALAHAEIEVQEHSDLTINIWDSASTATQKINFPWANEDYPYSLRGEVLGYNTSDIYAVVDKHTGALNVLDKAQNVAYYWIDDVRDLPWWVSGSPLQLILHWWMRDKELQLTHAGAVGYASGGVLLAGNSGAGKSTTALACINEGMQFVSEDYCLLSNSPKPYAYTAYSSAKLEQKTVDFFPDLKKYITNTGRRENEKAFLFQNSFRPEKIIAGFPLKTILILKIQKSPLSWLEDASSEAALKALSMSTMWQLSHSGTHTFAFLKKTAESVPCYYLHLGSDLKKIPSVIQGLL